MIKNMLNAFFSLVVTFLSAFGMGFIIAIPTKILANIGNYSITFTNITIILTSLLFLSEIISRYTFGVYLNNITKLLSYNNTINNSNLDKITELSDQVKEIKNDLSRKGEQ